MIRKSLIFISMMLSLTLQSQTGNQLNVSNLPYYNFGKGIGITSPDSLFQFNIRFRMQNRFTVSESENLLAFNGQIRRLRLRFDGFVGNPNFVYVIQLSFSPGDVGGELMEGENLSIIRDAMVYYKLSPKWHFGFGQTKLPGNRQRINSSGALQLSDRTINNANFNIDRDFGFFFNYLNEKPERFSYNVKSSVSLGEGRNFTETVNSGLAYTGKIELLPLGSFTRDGAYFEGDIFREPTPKIMVSGAFQFNHQAINTAGTLGSRMAETRDLSYLFLDAVMKYQGWAFMASYMMRYTQNPFNISPEGDPLVIYKGRGYDVQTSYYFPSRWEVISSYSYTAPDSQVSDIFPEQQNISLGLTRYIWEHAFKIQLEGSYLINNFSDGHQTHPLQLRLQIEMGI